MKTPKPAQKAAMALAAVILALACIAVPVAFADQAQADREVACPSAVCDAQEQCPGSFVDEDADGICDNRGNNCCTNTPACDGTGAKHQGQNANGQGRGCGGNGQGKGRCLYMQAG